jgi:hypothetical protein
LLETPNFYHYLNAVENLKISAAIKGRGVDDIDRVLEVVDLAKRKNSKFSTYSLGMKQRLAIGAALLGNPDVLVFDEPTNGLDPVGIAEIRELIKKLSKEGKTIIMARFIPIVRTFAPFVAGVGEMKYKTFLLFSIGGGALWVSSMTLLGYFFGNLEIVKNNFEIVVFGIIGISLLPVIIGALKAKFSRK